MCRKLFENPPSDIDTETRLNDEDLNIMLKPIIQDSKTYIDRYHGRNQRCVVGYDPMYSENWVVDYPPSPQKHPKYERLYQLWQTYDMKHEVVCCIFNRDKVIFTIVEVVPKPMTTTTTSQPAEKSSSIIEFATSMISSVLPSFNTNVPEFKPQLQPELPETPLLEKEEPKVQEVTEDVEKLTFGTVSVEVGDDGIMKCVSQDQDEEPKKEK